MIDILLGIARRFAEENLNNQIAPAHLFRAILHKDMGIVDYLENKLQKDYYYLVEWIEAQIQYLDKVSKLSDIEMSDAAVAVISEAETYKEQAGRK